MRIVLRALTTMLTAMVGLGLVIALGVVPPATAAGTSSIAGKVTGPGGTGASGATVAAFAYDGAQWRPVGATTTDGSGAYSLTGLAGGSYRVGFQFGNRTAYYPNAATVEAATDVSIADGAAVSGIDSQFDWGGTITGTVTGPGDAALRSATVSVYQKAPMGYWSNVSSVTTDEVGEYRVFGLAAGTYRVGFWAM